MNNGFFYFRNLITYNKILARGANFCKIHGKKKKFREFNVQYFENLQLFKHENVHTIIIAQGVGNRFFHY